MNTRLVLALALGLTGCAVSSEDSIGQSTDNIGMSNSDAQAVLDLVNYPGTDLEILDGRAAIDHRAAEGIISLRNGPDGVTPSADDKLFTSIAQIDAVAYVGDAALNRLLSYAHLFPAPAGEEVEGVAFAGWEAESVLWGVNHASVEVLDALAGLDSRAAKNLHAQAPFVNVGAMGPVGYVGTAALKVLRAQAVVWWAEMHGAANLAGTFDGVAFDEEAAENALAIANEAAREQMVDHGVPAPGAAAIVGNRPYDTLAQIAAVGGVGTATMRGLHDYAVSGAWPESCDAAVTDRSDQNAADITTLLANVNTGDWPYAELASFQVDACVNMADPATREQLLTQVRTSSAIHWDHTGPIADQYMQRVEFAPGTTLFAPRMDIAKDVIWEGINYEHSWTPSTPEDQALLSHLDAAHVALSDGPRYHANQYYEASLRIDAEECSEDVAVLFDTNTGIIWTFHRLPRC